VTIKTKNNSKIVFSNVANVRGQAIINILTVWGIILPMVSLRISSRRHLLSSYLFQQATLTSTKVLVLLVQKYK
jgi:Ca2+/Na+ antiporter